MNFSLGPAMEGTNEVIYVDIFSLRNYVHLNEVAKLYEATYGTPLSTVVTTEFADDMGNALVSICKYNGVSTGSQNHIHHLHLFCFFKCNIVSIKLSTSRRVSTFLLPAPVQQIVI